MGKKKDKKAKKNKQAGRGRRESGEAGRTQAQVETQRV